MEFGNPIVGQEDLIREAIQSPNFSVDPETGVSGWRIARDGTATFNSVVIGSGDYTIDENGNAVFTSVSADTMFLNGENLSDVLAELPRGLLALNLLPNDTATYDGTNRVLWGRIKITDFDVTRQYRFGGAGRIDCVASQPSYIQVHVYAEWDANASTSSDNIVNRQVARATTNSEDWLFDFQHVLNFDDIIGTGTDLNLAFYMSAGGVGQKYQGAAQGRVYVEDIGTKITYGSWTPAGGGGTQQYVKTYTATASDSFQSDGTDRNIDECYQGEYSGTNGNQFSMMAFDYSQIQSDLSGATINKVEVYLNNNHFYNNDGGTTIIGTHNQTGVGGDHSYGEVNANLSRHSWSKGQAKWVTVPSSIGNAFRDNTAKGLALGKGQTSGGSLSNSNEYYGYFAGATQSGPPKLRITYTK